MKSNQYILESEDFNALIALRDFAENAFLGYGGKAGETERRMADSYQWLVKEYLTLLEQTLKTLDEYEASEARYKSIFVPKK